MQDKIDYNNKWDKGREKMQTQFYTGSEKSIAYV